MRPALSVHASAERRARGPLLERMLHAFGADTAMVESVLGDLAEERAERAARDGAFRARLWHACEFVRAMPWLLASAVREGDWRGRATLSAVLALLALLGTALVLAVPTRLRAEGDAGEGVVINNVKAVQLGMRVLDVRGHALPLGGVRYQWRSGAPIPVSARGVAQCTYQGDAVVRASLGPLATDILVKCRPVSALSAGYEIGLVVGGPTRPIPIIAKDAWGRAAYPLRGELTVDDTSVVAIEQGPDGERHLRARAPGGAWLSVKVGDHASTVFVDAYRPAATPTGMRAGQRVAVGVRLSSHEFLRWTLSASREPYVIRMLPEREGMPAPLIAVTGADCFYAGHETFSCLVPTDATVYAYYPTTGSQAGERRGSLAVERFVKR